MIRTFRIGTAMAMASTIGVSVMATTMSAQANNCVAYGNIALKQARINQQRKCGNIGPRWHTILKEHVAWCASVGPTEWRNELKQRENALKQCQG
ncbi:MAG: hypothetical protein ACR2PA_22465 [Hyphomicrobiaceae bacterium]